jgi:hypothetical protein
MITPGVNGGFRIDVICAFSEMYKAGAKETHNYVFKIKRSTTLFIHGGFIRKLRG